jgi:hypothetical protein
VAVVGRERQVNEAKNASTAHYYITSLRCGVRKLACRERAALVWM